MAEISRTCLDRGSVDPLRHDHTFGQDRVMAGEKRTIIVIAITATMMVVEIASGILLGSMALLADGLHMASHAAALAIAAFAYIYARRHARDDRFSFGTGKVNALAGFTGAVLLAMFAVIMAWQSVDRFFHPVTIAFNLAILVAVVGLVVNGVCALILGSAGHTHGHHHPERHGGEGRKSQAGHRHDHGDHNLRAAYLHVLADALTSVLAILALVAGKLYGMVWMDPAMGLVGAVLVARWSLGLIRTTSCVLLDHQGPEHIGTAIRRAIEADHGTTVTDLHTWSIGPNMFAAIISVVATSPQSADHYKALVPLEAGLVHITVEVHRSQDDHLPPPQGPRQGT